MAGTVSVRRDETVGRLGCSPPRRRRGGRPELGHRCDELSPQPPQLPPGRPGCHPSGPKFAVPSPPTRIRFPGALPGGRWTRSTVEPGRRRSPFGLRPAQAPAGAQSWRLRAGPPLTALIGKASALQTWAADAEGMGRVSSVPGCAPLPTVRRGSTDREEPHSSATGFPTASRPLKGRHAVGGSGLPRSLWPDCPDSRSGDGHRDGGIADQGRGDQ